MWKSVWKACGWEHPRAPPDRMVFQADRATPAVLTFLWETKVGRMIRLTPPEEEEVGKRRAGLACPENIPLLCLSLVLYTFPLSLFPFLTIPSVAFMDGSPAMATGYQMVLWGIAGRIV